MDRRSHAMHGRRQHGMCWVTLLKNVWHCSAMHQIAVRSWWRELRGLLGPDARRGLGALRPDSFRYRLLCLGPRYVCESLASSMLPAPELSCALSHLS